MATARHNSAPRVIQGGMGAGVSDWRLARAVSLIGQLGLVSGTALDTILVRRLQDGDPDGAMRRSLARFPDQQVAERIIADYFIAGGKAADRPYRSKPLIGLRHSRGLTELLIAANFVEVDLAKEGHSGQVGINYLEKIQAPLLPSIFGAMLAGVDVITMGAGIPIKIPVILDRLAEGLPVRYEIALATGGTAEDATIHFDPADFPSLSRPLRRPLFYPIVSSALLANMLVKKSGGRIDGLIVEYPIAGGHNAPPRGRMTLDQDGEPIYGPRDAIDLDAIRALDLPFWLAGAFGSPEALQRALELGAAGVQVGTLFAFCRESGLRPDLKQEVLARTTSDRLRVRTDPLASPSGFPFKVVDLDQTYSESAVCAERERVCDLGYLREAHRKGDGKLTWRCPGEPIASWQRKEGSIEATEGRKCLCNGLLANIGLAQTRADGREELPLLTSGSDIAGLRRFATEHLGGYGAADVLHFILAAQPAATEVESSSSAS